LPAAAFVPPAVAAAGVPNPGVLPVPDPPRAPNPFVVDDALPFWERRSPLEVAEAPDPGAIWLSALSSEPEDEPPMNMSVSTRAIWRASPYFTR
jgi:hypothetical protein